MSAPRALTQYQRGPRSYALLVHACRGAAMQCASNHHSITCAAMMAPQARVCCPVLAPMLGLSRARHPHAPRLIFMTWKTPNNFFTTARPCRSRTQLSRLLLRRSTPTSSRTAVSMAAMHPPERSSSPKPRRRSPNMRANSLLLVEAEAVPPAGRGLSRSPLAKRRRS